MEIKVTLFGIPQRTLSEADVREVAEPVLGAGHPIEYYVEMFNAEYKGKGLKAKITNGSNN